MVFNYYIDSLQLICKDIDQNSIERAVEKIKESQMIFTAGNGGSYANASHFAQDLVKACDIKSYCLQDNTSLLTAMSNDFSYETSLETILVVLSRPEDVIFLISCSGQSDNILSVATWAKMYNRFVISLTGNPNNLLQKISNIDINIPTKDIKMCENIHTIILHYIIERLLD